MAKKKEDEQNTSGLPETTDTENSGSINPAAELAAAKADTSTAKRKKTVIISGAEFWEFAPKSEGAEYNGTIFQGYFRGVLKREKDGKDADKNPNERAGAVMGYNFEQEGTGLMFIIGNSHAIEKALEKTGQDETLLFEIEFLGKGQTANNKPYNRFEVSVLS